VIQLRYGITSGTTPTRFCMNCSHSDSRGATSYLYSGDLRAPTVEYDMIGIGMMDR